MEKIVYIDGDLRRDDPGVGLDSFELGMRAAIDVYTVDGPDDPAALRATADALQTFAIGPWHAGYCRGLRLVAYVLSALAES